MSDESDTDMGDLLQKLIGNNEDDDKDDSYEETSNILSKLIENNEDDDDNAAYEETSNLLSKLIGNNADDDNTESYEETSKILSKLNSNNENPEKTVSKNPEQKKVKILKELDFNFLDKVDEKPPETPINTKDKQISLIHTDCDTSDDEDNKYFDDQKYTDYGREIKQLNKKREFDHQTSTEIKLVEKKNVSIFSADDIKQKVKNNTFLPSPPKAKEVKDAKKLGPLSGWLNKPSDIYTDPVFGLRIVKPLVSSAELKERMRDRTAVTVAKIKHFIATQDLSNDWVIAGVLIQKSATKKSQKGNQYCIWTISDLSDNMNTVSIFLFKDAYKSFWKTSDGVVIGVLNPSVLESKNEKDQACLSVDKAQKIMILGNSKDLGRCKSKKKNGEPCNNFVNLSRCEYCVYHVKTEYSKASRRPDLGTDHMNRKFGSIGGNNNLKPNNLGSGMYSQANHHNNMLAIPAKRNFKMEQKDSERLALLRGGDSSESLKTKEFNESSLNKTAELTNNNDKKCLGRLGKIRGWNSPAILNVSGSQVASFSPAFKPKPAAVDTNKPGLNLSNLSPIPKLGKGIKGDFIDFSMPITKKHVNSAKANAIRWVKENGGLKESNPNKVKESKEKKEANKDKEVTKRRREEEDDSMKDQPKVKISKMSDEYRKMMEATSAHADLVEKAEDKEKEKYFHKLEAKEKMEEKMLNTFKVDCKAVKCLICKYTAFSASDMCKEKRHPLRVIDAVKSFFKCSDCGNRTVSLDRLPSTSCNKCSGSNWVRTGMMNEKKTNLAGPALSIRGGEEKFIGSDIKDANINLLIPDSGT